MGEEIYDYIFKQLENAIEEAKKYENKPTLGAKLLLRPKLSEQFITIKKLLHERKVAVAEAFIAEKNAPPPPATPAPAPIPKDKPKTTAVGVAKDEQKSDATTTINLASIVLTAKNQDNALREQLYCINNVLTEWQRITKKPDSIFSKEAFSVSPLNNLRQSLNKIKQDLTKKNNKQDSVRGDAGSLPKTVVSSDSSADDSLETTIEYEQLEFRWSTRYVDEKLIHGIEDKVLTMERLLVLRRKQSDQFKAFGIYGIAGVGKTTLCQSIFARPKVKEYFLPRIWVCMSRQKDDDGDRRKEIVKRMLMSLGVNNDIVTKLDQKEGLPLLLSTLRLQLIGKRYLIVLDDAGRGDDWFKLIDSSDTETESATINEFACGLPKGCGGTVIVTSCIKEVAENMVGDEENLRCVMPLTDQDTCWEIFKACAEKNGMKLPEGFENLKAEVVKRCDGLPLAATLMGRIKNEQLRHPPAAAVAAHHTA